MASGSKNRFRMGRSSSVAEESRPDEPITASTPRPSRPGALGALGAKMRAYSSPRQRRVSSHTSLDRPSLALDVKRHAQSRSSLVVSNGEGTKRNDYEIVPSPTTSLSFDGTSTPHHEDHISSAAAYKADRPRSGMSSAPTAAANISLRTKRPSISGLGGLGGVVRRWSAVGSPQSASPRSEEDSSTFNLHSFRRVASPSSPSPGPAPLPISRAESFVSAIEYDANSPSISKPPSPSVNQQGHQHRLSGSSYFTGADSSTTSSPNRQMNTNRMSAGRFRAGTAARSRPDVTSSAFFQDREQRPASPTSHNSGNVSPVMTGSSLPRSPGQELAELEAELARGRTTPLLRRGLDQEPLASADGGARGSRPSVAKQGSFSSLRDLNDGLQGDAAKGYGLDSARVLGSGTDGPRTLIDAISRMEQERNRGEANMQPPRLPWMDDGDSGNSSEMPSSKRRSGNMSSSSSKDSAATLQPSLQAPALVDGGDSPTPSTVDSAFVASVVQASPDHAIFTENASPFRHSRARSEGTLLDSSSSSENRRFTDEHQPTLTNGHVKRASYYGQSANTPWPGNRVSSAARRDRSPPPPPLPSKTEELMSFHARHAPAMASTVHQQHWRIAWPTPPCVEQGWFATLSALQQHSLYETHRKAAGVARDEYLQIMAAAVPPSALINPGNIFEAKVATNLQRSTTVTKPSPSSTSPAAVTVRERRSSMPAVSGPRLDEHSPPPLPSAPANVLTVVTDDEDEFAAFENLLQAVAELNFTLVRKDLESEFRPSSHERFQLIRRVMAQSKKYREPLKMWRS